MSTNQHGALGSNQPLERIIPEPPPEPAAKDENLEVLLNGDQTGRSDNDEKLEVLPPTEDDVVYLREDLRRR